MRRRLSPASSAAPQKKNPTGRLPCRKERLKSRLSVLPNRIKALSCAEDKRNAPDSRKTYYRIDDPADYRHRTAAYPRDEIKIENSYASPVESADNSENKSYSIYYHSIKPRKCENTPKRWAVIIFSHEKTNMSAKNWMEAAPKNFYWIFSKSAAPCLQSGQIKSSGRASPS